jgi:hypothetical protein
MWLWVANEWLFVGTQERDCTLPRVDEGRMSSTRKELLCRGESGGVDVLIVIMTFPGASLMEISAVEGGVRVRCPGCEQVTVYRGTFSDFGHADGCPVHTRIAEALRLYDQQVVRCG